MLPLATLPVALLLPTRPTLRAAPPPLSPLLRGAAARAPAPQCNAAAAVPAAVQATTVLTAGVVTDTLLDILVYGLLFGTAALTIYSLYVTLDESNKKAGGWTKPNDEDEYMPQATDYSKKNMIYNPATNEWRPKEASEMSSASSSSSAGGSGGGASGSGNRYEKRMMKKEKQRQKKKR